MKTKVQKLDLIYSDPGNQPDPGYMRGLKRVQRRATCVSKGGQMKLQVICDRHGMQTLEQMVCHAACILSCGCKIQAVNGSFEQIFAGKSGHTKWSPMGTPKRSKQLKMYDKATGPCPYCGRTEHWYNGVPLRAFCWGTGKKPHRQWRKLIPGGLQPYKE